MSESRFYHISPTGELAQPASLDGALSARQDGGFVWLDYCEPSKEELSVLIEPLGLHPLSIEDCFDENAVPKIEDYPNNTFILFNAFYYKSQLLVTLEVDLFIGDNFLVTVSQHEPNGRPVLHDIEKRIRQEIENARQGPSFLAHIIIDSIVDQKFVAIDALEDELDRAEDTILDDYAHFDPGELVRLRRDLLAVRKSLFHEREILVKICRKDSLFIVEKAILFYRDIYDHLAKFFELTESYRDLVSSLMEMYLSMINNQMTKSANDTNITVRRLTFITTIFMPLTLLAGIGGMSEYSMMTGASNWRIAYPAFLLAMVAIGVGSYFILKWIDRRGGKGNK
jgi:magnesium transporter